MAKASKSRPARKMPSRVDVQVDKDSSMSIRKIENGFLVSESGTKGKGKNKEWYDKTYYTPTNPVAAITKGAGAKFGGKK